MRVAGGQRQRAGAELVEGTATGDYPAERLVAAGVDDECAAVGNGCAIIAAAQDTRAADRKRAAADGRRAAVGIITGKNFQTRAALDQVDRAGAVFDDSAERAGPVGHAHRQSVSVILALVDGARP